MNAQLMYAGLSATVLSAVLVGTGYADAATVGSPSEAEADSTMQGRGSGPLADTPTSPDKRTDLSGSTQGSVADEYATTPVRQGKLREVTDSKWLGKSAYSSQGEVVGTIKQVLKDQTTGQIEYVMLLPKDAKAPIPLRWSQFQEKHDKLQLNVKKEDLKTALDASSTKDLSPDIQEYMGQINQVRSATKAGTSSGSATSAPSSVGSMGEAETAKGGASGPQTLPEGKAPGFEGGNQAASVRPATTEGHPDQRYTIVRC